MRPIAPLSSEKLNLCSDSSTSSIKASDSKKSLKNHPNPSDWKHKPLKPIHKVTRKYRSRSANPPSGPSKVLLPPMTVNQSSAVAAVSLSPGVTTSLNSSNLMNSRPLSLMRGSILTNGNHSGNGSESKGLTPISTSTPVVPQLQLRMIQSAPNAVSRSVNLPPILQSKTPSKNLQSNISSNHCNAPTPTPILKSTITPSKEKKNQMNKQLPLTPIEKKESYEEYEEVGGILAPRK